MGIDKQVRESKPILFTLGMFLLILGITLVLVWWKDVLTVFRGMIGVIIALGGLLFLYMMQE